MVLRCTQYCRHLCLTSVGKIFTNNSDNSTIICFWKNILFRCSVMVNNWRCEIRKGHEEKNNDSTDHIHQHENTTIVPRHTPEDQIKSNKMFCLANTILWSRDMDNCKLTVVQTWWLRDVEYWKYHGRKWLPTKKYLRKGWDQAEKLCDNSIRGNYNLGHLIRYISTTTNRRKDRRQKIPWLTKNYLHNGFHKQHASQVLPTKETCRRGKKMAWSRSQPRSRDDTS